MTVRICVDVTNPGQFFAACGLFELATRIEPDALGFFEHGYFIVEVAFDLNVLLGRVLEVPVMEVKASTPERNADGDEEESVDRSAPLGIGAPFDLRLDWWRDRSAGGRDLKVWAGTMNNVRIAGAMFAAMQRSSEFYSERLFDVGQVVGEPGNASKKVEPFYFDARRAPNAHSRDVGFSPDALDLTTTAFPAVELFCLIGLQRFRPAPDRRRRRVFRYRVWGTPLPVELAAAVVAGVLPLKGQRIFEFENWFRTGQKKHKAFRVAVPVAQGE